MAVWSSDPAREALTARPAPKGKPAADGRQARAASEPPPDAAALAGRPTEGLAVHLLGPFRVEVYAQPAAQWNGNKARAIFRYLVVHRRQKVPKEVLMEALWPGSEPEAARVSLKVAVSSLRRSLSAPVGELADSHEWVVSEGDTYQLEPGLPVWVDAEEFEAQSLLAQGLERQGALEASVKSYRQAVALYAGDFLEENPYDEWTILERERLRDLYLQNLTRLSRHLVEMAEWQDAILYLHKILAVDACQEETYRQLMICHAALGQLGRVRQVHSICHQVLHKELDSTPSQELDALLIKLISGAGK